MSINSYDVGQECPKCGFQMHRHDYIGVFCPLCAYRSIEQSFALADRATSTHPTNPELPTIPPGHPARGGLTT